MAGRKGGREEGQRERERQGNEVERQEEKEREKFCWREHIGWIWKRIREGSRKRERERRE